MVALFGVRVDFAKATFAGLNRFLTFTSIPDNVRDDLLLYHTHGEIGHARTLY